MTDKIRSAFGETQAAAGASVDAMLDEALRELYAHYGKGELPAHLVELAHRLEAARNAARADKRDDAPEQMRSRGTGAED